MQQETLSVAQSETLQQLQQLQKGEVVLPTGNRETEVDDEMDHLPEASAPEAAPVQASSESEEVEIDGQRFANQKEAFNYLKSRVGQLETERLLDEARMEGRTEALQYIPQLTQQPIVPQSIEEEVNMDKFYEDPKGFMREYGQKIYEKVKNEVTQAQIVQQQQEQLWTTFTSKYPDLADFRSDVDAVANENAETIKALATRNKEKAMEFVALKTREKFQRYMEALKPTRNLPNTKQTVSAGGNPGVTTTQKTSQVDKPLDFTAQLRQFRRK